MANQHGTDHENAAEDAGGSIASRAVRWIAAHRLVVAGVALTLIGIATTCAFLFFGGSPEEQLAGATQVLEALDQGDELAAESLAKEINDRYLAMARDRSAASYVLGVLASRRAERMLGAGRTRHYHKAARLLMRSANIGLPPGRENQALLLLGESLLYSGDVQASRIPLRQVARANANVSPEVYRLLADAYFQEPKAEPATALGYVDKYLASPDLEPAGRDRSELLRAEILLALEKFDEARGALSSLVGRTAAIETQVIDAEIDFEEARKLRQGAALSQRGEDAAKADELTQGAIDKLRKTEASAPRDHESIASAMYLIGLCFLDLGDPRAALDQFQRTYKRYVDSAAGWAALVEMGQIKLTLREDDEALAAFAEALRARRQSGWQTNRWIGQEDFRDRLVKAYGTFIEHGAFQDAISLAGDMAPPIADEDSQELKAKGYQSWGRRLLADAGRMAPNEAKNQRRQARAKYREAGKLFHQLAQRRFATRFYPTDLWNAAECYFDAQNYPVAVAYLREFLARAAKKDRPAGLLALGKSLLALGKYQDSVAALQECIEYYTRHPAQFEARIVCSHAYQEQGELVKAERSLRDNLEGELLSPASKEWRESLFALAALLHQTGRYEDATVRLQEAIERYPDERETIVARYLLADCHLQLAARFSAQLEHELVEETRRWLVESHRRHCEQAVTFFERLLEALRNREASAELTADQRAIERTSLFNQAAALFSLERYPQAIDAYSSALSRYQNAPESLAAYVQIAICHRRLGHPDEAQTALSLAKVALERLPADAGFVAATGLPRDHWSSYLTWLRAL